MKRTITILSFLLLLIACTPYGVTKVNLRKAFRQKTSAKDLYARVDVIPLRVPEGVNYYFCPACRLEEYVLPGTVTLPKDTEYILLKYTL